MEAWKQNLTSFTAQVVGKTLVFLNASQSACRFHECNLGNLICDAMVGPGQSRFWFRFCRHSCLCLPGGQLHPVL